MLSTLLLSAALALASQTKATEKNYTIDFAGTTKDLQAGKTGALRFSIKATPGFHVSTEAPLKIGLAAPGVDLKKTALTRDDAKDKKSEAPEFDVGFTCSAAGDKAINVDALFFVCNEKICERKTEKLSVPLSVKP